MGWDRVEKIAGKRKEGCYNVEQLKFDISGDFSWTHGSEDIQLIAGVWFKSKLDHVVCMCVCEFSYHADGKTKGFWAKQTNKSNQAEQVEILIYWSGKHWDEGWGTKSPRPS